MGGKDYPAILVTTGDTDDRVVPAHSFKYAAALQAAELGPKPRLIRIDTKAGHGAGKPVDKLIDEYAERYAFAAYSAGLKLDPAAKWRGRSGLRQSGRAQVWTTVTNAPIVCL